MKETELPEVAVECSVTVSCQCGCGRVETVVMPVQLSQVGGVTLWVNSTIEVAVGLHWGVFKPTFSEDLSMLDGK